MFPHSHRTRDVVLLSVLVWLVLLAVLPGKAWGFGTINRIKQNGELRVAVFEGPGRIDDRRMLQGLADSLGVDLTLHPVAAHDGLLAALRSGQVDLVGEPVSVHRSWPQGLTISRPVRHADLWLVSSAAGGQQSTLGVQFASDAWYQALARREELDGIQVRVADGAWTTPQLLGRVAHGDFGFTLAYDIDLENIEREHIGLKPDRRLQDQIALGWVMRSSDRVLTHRVNRYLETWGLTRDVRIVDRGDWDRILERGRLRLVTLYRPETYFAWSGRLLGLDFELVEAFARGHGLALDVVLANDRADLMARLARGEADIGAALMRADQLDSTLIAGRPYFSGPGVVVAKRDRFRTMSVLDLHGKSIRLPSDSPYRRQILDWQDAGVGMDVDWVAAGTDPGVLIDAVVGGQIDLTIVDEFRYRLEKSWRDTIDAPLAVSVDVERVWAVRAGNPQLLKQVDQHWGNARGKLGYNLLVDKYFGAASDSFRSAFAAYARDHAISPYDDLVRRYAAYYDFDWRLILAVIFQESRFDPDALSVSGAQGLMQLKPTAARQVGIDNIFEPRQSIHAGVRYLDWLRDRFEADLDVRDRLWFSLASYNGGLTHIRAARLQAQRMGLDPRRWFGHVEQALIALIQQGGETYASVDAGQIVGYVSHIRERYRSYVHLTGPNPGRGPVMARNDAATNRDAESRPSGLGFLE